MVDRSIVLDKCRNLVDFQLWPPSMESRLEPWLDNFSSAELDSALHLLNSYTFISKEMTTELFKAAFNGISAIDIQNPATLRTDWSNLFDTLQVTLVTGENPSPADSGYIFTRSCRDVVGIEEERLQHPSDLLDSLYAGGVGAVVFVDDFVGSGQQFINTWNRPYETRTAGQVSFFSYAASGAPTRFFYCAAVCTQEGFNAIRANCPQVTVSAGNFLGPHHGVFDMQSKVWSGEAQVKGIADLKSASLRCGIPDDGSQYDWRGFHQLGLCLGFDHSLPDASLPIFSWAENQWAPLVVRS